MSQCQAEEHFITVTGHFNYLNEILVRTFYVNLQKKAKNQQKESQHHI